ncbi:hypothetical protein [Sphingobium sp.]|uniref:hypothetical protein n=1 Tax=Sphingobium sp. TaxID=1912891 RepID=UPI002D7F227D|nr:hypothetical protein [Sphingobium sp.]
MAEGPAIVEGRKRHRDQRDAVQMAVQPAHVVRRVDQHAKAGFAALGDFRQEIVEPDDRLLVRARLGVLGFDHPGIIGHKTGFVPDFRHDRSPQAAAAVLSP